MRPLPTHLPTTQAFLLPPLPSTQASEVAPRANGQRVVELHPLRPPPSCTDSRRMLWPPAAALQASAFFWIDLLEPPTANHPHTHLCRTLPVPSGTEEAAGDRVWSRVPGFWPESLSSWDSRTRALRPRPIHPPAVLKQSLKFSGLGATGQVTREAEGAPDSR